MIPVTSEQDKEQLKEHALKLIEQNDFEGLIILIEILKETNFDFHDKKNALLFAVSNGYLEIVKYLVNRGMDITITDNIAVRWAAEHGHLDIVKYLIAQGADIHARDEEPLRWAAARGHLETVKYLVEQGADIHAQKDKALRYAVYYDGNLEVIKYLVESGADIHADNDYVLRYAAEEIAGYLEEVLKNDSNRK